LASHQRFSFQILFNRYREKEREREREREKERERERERDKDCLFSRSFCVPTT
jgi:hypothetical protein